MSLFFALKKWYKIHFYLLKWILKNKIIIIWHSSAESEKVPSYCFYTYTKEVKKKKKKKKILFFSFFPINFF